MPDEVAFFYIFRSLDKGFSDFYHARMVPAISHISAARFWLSCGQQDIPRHFLDSSSSSKECPLSADSHLGNASRRALAANRQAGIADCHRDTATCRHNAAERRPLSADCLDAARSTFSIEQDEPLHFLVSGQNNRRILEGAVSHSINGELPPRSILGYSAGAKIGIVSPEISFIQMACLLSRIDAIRYGSALCGRFAAPANTGELPARKPLTNVHDIRKHLKASPRMSGRKQASAVLPYIIENTRSPREIDIALFLSLPIRKGGFGLPRPVINESVRLDKPLRTRNQYGGTSYIESFECDMVWHISGKTIVVEYQGEQYHERQFNIHRDSIKRNALIEQGVRVFTLSNEQFRDFDQFKRFATLLKETLGVRPRSRISDSEQRQKSLHAQLVRPFAL